MSKTILFKQEAKDRLLEGIKKVNDAVSVTMGPYGRNVLMEKEYGEIASTKDGVTVAKSITLKDPVENMAATVIKQAAEKTVDAAGDGTTTATVLSHSIASQALLYTKLPKVNVTKVKNGIEQALKEVVNELKKTSKNIAGEDQITQVATLSANGDIEIGKLVNTALEKVGRDGLVRVEESKSGETSLDTVEGIQFDRGYKSPYFVTDNNSMSAVLEDPYILITDRKVSSITTLLPLLEKISSEGKSLLVIAEDIDGEALATLVVNKGRGSLKVAAVKAPGFGEIREHMLEDIAILTGGTVIANSKAMKFDKLEMSWLGRARVVTVTKENTTIIDGKGNIDSIKERILAVKTQLEKEATPYNREKLQERLSKMAGGAAVINIGGSTEIEIKEKKDRLEDALQAAKAAISEGVVPGAGIALYRIAEKLIKTTGLDGDFNFGKIIVLKACKQPLRQILTNAGEDIEEWDALLQGSDDINLVPVIGKKELVDAFEAGIIDPTKVVRCALENAVGAAVTIVMTECTINNDPDVKKDNLGGMANL